MTSVYLCVVLDLMDTVTRECHDTGPYYLLKLHFMYYWEESDDVYFQLFLYFSNFHLVQMGGEKLRDCPRNFCYSSLDQTSKNQREKYRHLMG